MLRVEQIIKDAKHISTGLSDGSYVPARPIQFNATRPGGTPMWDRLRDAWEVICGRADAVQWTGQ
jgi:hypothetical protein